jgi:flagellar hook-associated protein 2
MNNNVISSLGAGSGLNVRQMVSDLAAASRAPKVERITTLTQQNQARISAVAQARSDLDGLVRSLGQMITDGTLRSTPVASDPAVLTLTAAAGIAPKDFSGQVEVMQLARGQSLNSAIIASRTAPIGEGSFTLTMGGATTPISITAANNSLDGLANAINGANAGVKASIVGDGGGFRLVLRGPSGAANGFSLALGPGADPALAAFASSPAGGMITAQPASDAMIKIDGVAFSRPGNSIADVIPGLTLDLKKASPGQIVDIGAARPTAAIRQAAQDFVDVFNQLKTSLKAATRSANGETGLRALDNELLGVAGQTLLSQGPTTRLSDIGITGTKDGTLVLNSAKLDQALAADPDGVEALFNPVRSDTRTAATDPGLAGALQAIRDRAAASNGALDRITKSLSERQKVLASSLEQIERRETAYAARLEKQFGSLDLRVGSLRATQAYLTQQVALWTRSDT